MSALTNTRSLTSHWLRRTHDRRANRAKPQPTRYGLTIVLNGITADDYLQWVRDPDPPAGAEVTLIEVRPTPLGDRIELELLTPGKPPAHRDAAIAVGFPITPEVIGIHRMPLPTNRGQDRKPTFVAAPADHVCCDAAP